jgi:hypothetical protein
MAGWKRCGKDGVGDDFWRGNIICVEAVTATVPFLRLNPATDFDFYYVFIFILKFYYRCPRNIGGGVFL